MRPQKCTFSFLSAVPDTDKQITLQISDANENNDLLLDLAKVQATKSSPNSNFESHYFCSILQKTYEVVVR